MFDFKDAHCIMLEFTHNPPTAAPTCYHKAMTFKFLFRNYLDWITERRPSAVGFEHSASIPIPHCFDQPPL